MNDTYESNKPKMATCPLGWVTFFKTSRYQGILKATVSGVFGDLKFISEGSDQNWSCPESALLTVWELKY